MKQDYLKKLYEPNYHYCTRTYGSNTSVEHRLGSFDAQKEWKKEKEACAKFLNTKAYKSFIKDDYVILIGRTGTGKTSILKRLQYDIESGTNKDYKYVIPINFKPYLVELLKYGEINNTTQGLSDLADNIHMMLDLEVIRMVYSKTDYTKQNPSFANRIKKYLTDKKITERTNIFRKAIEEMAEIYKEKFAGNILSTISVLDNLKKRYINSEYDEILNDIYKYLSNNKVVILVDTMDRYNIRESGVVIVIQTLVEQAFEYYNNYESNNILVKIALPAELASVFVYKLPEKKQQNAVVIEWKYKELINMLAIRFYYYCKYKSNNPILKPLTNGLKLDDFYDNYELSKKFMLNILPQKCKTHMSLCFDTLAYCIRHTQKKPRQLMKIFNIFIDYVITQNDIKYFFTHQRMIGRCIHISQSDLIKDTVNMYGGLTNDRILQLCSRILLKKRFFIKKEDLMVEIKSALKEIPAKSLDDTRIDSDDFFEILKESGLIGKIHRERYVEPNNYFFENNKVLKILIALYEYQVKEKLPFQNEDICVLHPMCYEYYENEIDYNTLVYPASVDDEEDLGDVGKYLIDVLFDEDDE